MVATKRARIWRKSNPSARTLQFRSGFLAMTQPKAGQPARFETKPARWPSAAVLKHADAKRWLCREAIRVNGTLHAPRSWKEPLTPTLSPRDGRRAFRTNAAVR